MSFIVFKLQGELVSIYAPTPGDIQIALCSVLLKIVTFAVKGGMSMCKADIVSWPLIGVKVQNNDRVQMDNVPWMQGRLYVGIDTQWPWGKNPKTESSPPK